MSFQSCIIAIGKMKSSSPFSLAYDDYAKRLKGKCDLFELETAQQNEEIEKIKNKITPHQALVVLDERGKTMGSVELADKLAALQIEKSGKIQFVIGGADGLDDELRQKADVVLSFGKMTWPHMLVRVMLIEQIYRAHTILSHHPYHREG